MYVWRHKPSGKYLGETWTPNLNQAKQFKHLGRCKRLKTYAPYNFVNIKNEDLEIVHFKYVEVNSYDILGNSQ